MVKNFLNLLCSSFLVFGLLLLSANAETEERNKLPIEENSEAFQHFINGDLYELSGDVGKAIEEYQKARTLEPNVPEIRLALARLYFSTREIDSAKVEILQIEPKNNEAYGMLGDCYRFLGNADSALMAYQEAVKLDSTDLRSFWQLATIWQEKNELEKSIVAWQKVASLSPFSAPVHLQLAVLLFQTKDYDEAIKE